MTESAGAIGATELHPWYGPCDAFGPDRECAECAKTRFATREAWEAWLRSTGAAPEPRDWPCSVCGGKPLASGRPCICGGRGTEAAEAQGLREELLSWEIAAGLIPALAPHTSDKHKYFVTPTEPLSQKGMTLRDYFAAAALTGFLSAPGDSMSQDVGPNARANPGRAAEWAYAQADAMLAAREAQ